MNKIERQIVLADARADYLDTDDQSWTVDRDMHRANAQSLRLLNDVANAAEKVLSVAAPLDDPDPHWCQVRIDDCEQTEEALAAWKEHSDE